VSTAPATPSGPVQLALVVDNDSVDHHLDSAEPARDAAHAPTAPPSWGHALLERWLDELVATARETGREFYSRADVLGETLTQIDAALERILRADPEAAAALGSSKLATERACNAALLLEDVRAGDVPDDFERRLFAPLGIDPSAWDTPAELADDAHDETQHVSDGDEEPRDDVSDDDEDTHEAHEAPTADNAPPSHLTECEGARPSLRAPSCTDPRPLPESECAHES